MLALIHDVRWFHRFVLHFVLHVRCLVRVLYPVSPPILVVSKSNVRFLWTGSPHHGKNRHARPRLPDGPTKPAVLKEDGLDSQRVMARYFRHNGSMMQYGRALSACASPRARHMVCTGTCFHSAPVYRVPDRYYLKIIDIPPKGGGRGDVWSWCGWGWGWAGETVGMTRTVPVPRLRPYVSCVSCSVVILR